MHNIDLFKDYENAKVESVSEFMEKNAAGTYAFDELERLDIDGIPIAVTRNAEGRLMASFIPDTHLLAIGATRCGKTTGYVIPTINVLMKKKNKPSFIISDPKQELYKCSAKKLEDAGYHVIYLDFTDYRHSDCWNPLTKYYRLYQRYLNVENEVTIVNTEKGRRHCFRDVIYEDYDLLDRVIAEIKEGYYAEIEKGISTISMSILPTVNTRDPYWENAARDVLCAILYGMLEDSAPGVKEGRITEETFSFDTVLRIIDSFSDTNASYDGGYFTHRLRESSKAYQLADKCIIEQAEKTRSCIIATFASKMNIFRDTSIRRITCTNSFEAKELDGERPTAIFLSYKDEEPLHYDIISMFLYNFYTELINVSRENGAPLKRPFYFLLDEFGNLPKFNGFSNVISACGGRNIWFLIILQSYAQLYQVYGKETADIIKDNLNAHIFFGTNNPATKQDFSVECGQKTIISPVSALNGSGECIDRFDKETVSLVPVSSLNRITAGECYVTRMREEVLLSRIERSYECPEFDGEQADPKKRPPRVLFSDSKYIYNVPDYETKRRSSFVPVDI